MGFECSKCGLCCKCLDGVSGMEGYHAGDGVCNFLEPDTNLCLIYDSRPVMCNVDEGYDEYFSGIMTREEFYAENTAACKVLQDLNKESSELGLILQKQKDA